MEYLNSIWQIGIIALVVGAMIGALAYRYFSPSVRHSEEIKSELDHAKRQLSNYKASVNSHFEKTSELVNDLTQNYVKVYRHLAEGAQTLGDSRQLNNLLEQQRGKVLLTVDDETEASRTAAVDSSLDSSPASETAGESPLDGSESPSAGKRGPAGSPESVADESNTQREAAGETAAETGEPPETVKRERSGTEKSAPGTAAAVEPQTAATEEVTEDAGEPVLDVDRLRSVDAGGNEASVEAGRVVSEHGEVREAPPTRH